jgi:protein involved in polysaccharide export with SLBB domain
LPLAGGVDATNLDPAELAQRVRFRLQPYVRKVAVDVQLVAQAQSIFVSGGPGGVLAYSPGENLSSVFAQLRAQNVALNPNIPGQAMSDIDHSRADLQHVEILRDGAKLGPFDATNGGIDASGFSPVLQAGDTVELPNKPIKVAVRGDVKQPGVAYLSPDESLSSAITQAGGELPTSATNDITLIRGGIRHQEAFGSTAFAEPAQSGDIIYVPRAPTVTVVGMVVKPGDLQLHNNSTLVAALYSAEGIQKWADLRHVQVLHQGHNTTYDITKLTHGDLSQNPQLADGDTVFVPEGHKIDWTILFAGLGTSLGLANRFIPVHYVP